jgi:hypothetical protein
MESHSRRPFAPTQPTVRAPELDPCTYVEVVSPAFDSNRVLLRRVFFLNDDKSKYISVGFYTAQNYQTLVEFGGAKRLPILLTSDYVAAMAERLPALVEAICRNERHQFWSEDKAFRMKSQAVTGLPE